MILFLISKSRMIKQGNISYQYGASQILTTELH